MAVGAPGNGPEQPVSQEGACRAGLKDVFKWTVVQRVLRSLGSVPARRDTPSGEIPHPDGLQISTATLITVCCHLLATWVRCSELETDWQEVARLLGAEPKHRLRLSVFPKRMTLEGPTMILFIKPHKNRDFYKKQYPSFMYYLLNQLYFAVMYHVTLQGSGGD